MKSGDLVGHATGPPLSKVRLSGDFVGHATGPPLSTVGLIQVTLRAMQQVGLYLQWD